MTRSGRKGGAGDKQPPRPEDQPEDEGRYTTFRFYTADAKDLRALAALGTEEYGSSIAEVFHRVGAPAIREALNKVMRRRLDQE